MLTRAEARQQNMDHEAAPSTGLGGRGFRPRESMANAAIRSAHSSQLEGHKGRLVVFACEKGAVFGISRSSPVNRWGGLLFGHSPIKGPRSRRRPRGGGKPRSFLGHLGFPFLQCWPVSLLM